MSTLSTQISAMTRTLLDFAFPPLCAGCGEYVDDDRSICSRCQGLFDAYEFPFCVRCRLQVAVWPECPSCGRDLLPLFAFGNYVDPLKQVIIEMKFGGLLDSIPELVEKFVPVFADRIDSRQADCLVPIPLHPIREYARGYNQALEIAAHLSSKLGLPVADDLIVRNTKRRPQQTLPASERAGNIRGVFEALEHDPAPQRILLVDDVVTSGETVLEAARILESAGHVVVGAIALAHGR
jgi:ComF family protein